ncbi:hypothetical protein RJ641_017826 [Dillenia turbinata]|uniref:Uncharacterized protein n=1 Tax=Dillenia turbinata TaxID=194707 RepID=A0AAN8UKC4_9MAGN
MTIMTPFASIAAFRVVAVSSCGAAATLVATSVVTSLSPPGIHKDDFQLSSHLADTVSFLLIICFVASDLVRRRCFHNCNRSKSCCGLSNHINIAGSEAYDVVTNALGMVFAYALALTFTLECTFQQVNQLHTHDTIRHARVLENRVDGVADVPVGCGHGCSTYHPTGVALISMEAWLRLITHSMVFLDLDLRIYL